MTTNKIPPIHCCGCGRRQNMATNFTGDCQPSEGNLLICFYCGHLMKIVAGGAVREPTADELRFLQTIPGQWSLIRRAQRKIRLENPAAAAEHSKHSPE